jgi:hypothetical protein
MRSFHRLLTVFVAFSAASCLPKGGHVDEGPGSLEAVRQRLAGDWELVSLTTGVESGQPKSWNVGGRLHYDAFGSFTVRLARSDAPNGSNSPLFLDFTAEAIIDVEHQLIRLEHIENRAGSTEIPAALGPDRPRRYEFQGALLKTHALDEQNRITATFVWRRVSSAP